MNKRLAAFALVIVALGALLWSQQRVQPLTVSFLDIGQGDAEVIRTPAGQVILVDGGPDRTILGKLGAALPWNTKTIDLVVLSHPHADHVTGLTYVLTRYRVRHVLMTGAVHTTPEYLRFLELIRQQRIPVTIARAGQRFMLSGGVELEVLWPQQPYEGVRVDDLNATSIVNSISLGQHRVLFTGDTPAENEAALLRSGANVKADILKVAHQGSRTSSSEPFLRAVAPEYASISVGKGNTYGHPHAEIVERLRRMVPHVFRTDQDGDVTLSLENDRWVRR